MTYEEVWLSLSDNHTFLHNILKMMKSYIISGLFLLLAFSCKQTPSNESFMLTASVKDSEGGEATLLFFDKEKNAMDTVAHTNIENSSFVFDSANFVFDGPTKLTLVVKPELIDGKMQRYHRRYVILDDKPQTMNVWVFSADCDIPESTYNNRIINMDKNYPELMVLSDSIAEVARMFREEFTEEEKKTRLTEVREKLADLNKQYNSLKTEVVISEYEDSDDYLFRALLMDVYGRSLKPEQYIQFADEVIPELTEGTRIQFSIAEQKKVYEQLLKLAVGSPYINISLKDALGVSHELSEAVANSKYVLLDFWATWCGPCNAEMPNLREAYATYHDKGFEVFMVSIDKKTEDWEERSEKENFPWISTIVLPDDLTNAQETYSISAIPTNFLIDSDGTIIAHDLRGEKLEEKLAELLGS